VIIWFPQSNGATFSLSRAVRRLNLIGTGFLVVSEPESVIGLSFHRIMEHTYQFTFRRRRLARWLCLSSYKLFTLFLGQDTNTAGYRLITVRVLVYPSLRTICTHFSTSRQTNCLLSLVYHTYLYLSISGQFSEREYLITICTLEKYDLSLCLSKLDERESAERVAFNSGK